MERLGPLAHWLAQRAAPGFVHLITFFGGGVLALWFVRVRAIREGWLAGGGAFIGGEPFAELRALGAFRWFEVPDISVV